ncbi:glycosyltransferase family 39 protein [Candidatus Microgenomates bacterium]|nr:glycosyltransferase family 39 protein [Candidatus Microgenomates bacterium]
MNIVFILTIGFITRLFSLNQSLWLDEATTGLVSQMPTADIFSKFLVNDFHPPLYYLFMRGWSLIFGSSEIALRTPSILFSLATIYLVHEIYKLLVNKKDAWIPALMLATSGLFVYYSQEARAYMMSTFLVTLAIFSFVKMVKSPRVGYGLLFSLSLAFLSMSDYLPNFVILVFWIIGMKKYIASHIILAISWLLWLPIFLKQLTGGLSVSSNSPAWWDILGKFSFKEIILIPTKFIIGRVSLDNKILYGGLVLVLLLLFSFLIYKSLKAFKKVKLIYLWLFVPLGLTILLSIKLPVLTYFRLLFVLPAFYILVSVGVTNLKKPWKNLALGLLVFINLTTTVYYLSNTKFHRENWREIVLDIKATESVAVFPSMAQREAFLYYEGGPKIVEVQNLTKEEKGVWLMRYVSEISDPKDTARATIEQLGYKKVGEVDYNGVLVWKYEK